MSLWIPRRTADGRLYWYSVGVPIFALGPVLAVCLLLLVELATKAPLESLAFFAGMLLFGFTAFLVAKISVFQASIWFSFGSRRMTRRMRRFYRLGYLLMVPGAVMTLLLSTLVIRLYG